MRAPPTQTEALSALDIALTPLSTGKIDSGLECQACLELAEYGASLVLQGKMTEILEPATLHGHLRTAVATRAFPALPWAQLVGTMLQLVGSFLAGQSVPAAK